ncbi:MAG: sulfatase [bacterium]
MTSTQMLRQLFNAVFYAGIKLVSLCALFMLNAGELYAIQPNLLILIADDHSQADSEAYGSNEVKTPFLKKLAAEGMRFDRAFVNSPSCAPSRAALLTGLTPPRNGSEANHSKPRPELAKLPGELKRLGYEVVAFGKVSHYQHTADYGFDHYAFDTYQDHRGIAAARDWLEKRAGNPAEKRPVAIFVGSNWPHVPWPPADGYQPEDVQVTPNQIDTPEYRQARARYLTAVTAMDEELGSVHESAMKTLGRDKTLVLFTSDHGSQLPFGKWNLYDAGIRVPLVVKWPGTVPPGTATQAMVQWMDIMPTLIEVAGGKPLGNLDGKSFLPVLKDASKDHQQAIFTTHSSDGNMNVYPMRSVRTDRWKLIWNLHPEFQFTTHIDRANEPLSQSYWNSWLKKAGADMTAQKLVGRYHIRPEFELYDLQNDPDELVNVAADARSADEFTKLKARLLDWMESHGDQRKVFGQPVRVGEKILPLPKTPAKKKAVGKK